MRIENTSSNARFHLATNGTVIGFDVLLSKLTCSKFDEKRRQSFRSFGRSQLSYVCSPLVCLRADPSDEGREKADSSILSPQLSSTLSFSFMRPFSAFQTGEVVLLNRIKSSHFTRSPFSSWHSFLETVMTLPTVDFVEAISF